VEDVRESASLPDRLSLKDSNGNQTLVDYVLDGRGNVNGLGEVLSGLTGSTEDPFSNPDQHVLVKVFDGSDLNGITVGKKLKNEDVYLFGPASGVVTKTGTNVGQNTVSLFLNAPLNEMGGEALLRECLQKLQRGEMGSASERVSQNAQLKRLFDEFETSRELPTDLETIPPPVRVSLPTRTINLRDPLESDPTVHLATLNDLLSRARVTDASPGSRVRIVISYDPQTPPGNTATIQAPSGLGDAVSEWVKGPGASYVKGLSPQRPLVIERGVDAATGRVVPVETYL
jgi:hypothetical protein